MPATLGEEDDVSEPKVEAARGLSVERAREWGVEAKLKPVWAAVESGGEGMGAAPVVVKGGGE